MKIVHVANFYGPHSGGIKTTIHNLGLGYQRHGHEFVYVIPGSQYRSEITPYGEKITMPSWILPGSGGYRVMKSTAALKAEIERLQPDRLEVSDRFTLASLGRWAKTHRIPALVFSHETLAGLAERFLPNYLPLQSLVDWHNRRLANSFKQVAVTTAFAAREFERIHATNIRRVSLGVDLTNFSESNYSEELRETLAKGSRYLIIHCGRLSPEKEPQRSIDTLIELRRRGVDARLVVLGTGPLWKKLRARAKGQPVDFLGYIADPRKVAAILSSADVSLAPGPLETFCLAALESLASGTPVVASKSSAVGEFLQIEGSHPGGLVAADDRISFARAVWAVLADSEFRSSARKSARIFSWESTVDRMLDIHGINRFGENAPSATTKLRLRAA